MIEIDKSSDGYKQLKAVTQGLSVAKAKAETEVLIEEVDITFSESSSNYSQESESKDYTETAEK